MFDNKSVENFFLNSPEGYTLFIVEKRFVNTRGYSFFQQFQGKPNYLSSKYDVKQYIGSIFTSLQKKIPNLADLVSLVFSQKTRFNAASLASPLAKIAFANEVQAINPMKINPVIIEEAAVSDRDIATIVSLYHHSTIQPTIIITLNGNDFGNAKKLVQKCPHGLNVNMIKNNGQVLAYKIINTGERDVEGFIDAFSRHCFSSCSNTEKEILLNEEWEKHSLIRRYMPTILKIRSDLLYDQKEKVKILSTCILSELEAVTGLSQSDEKLLETLIFLTKLAKVYAFDHAGKDLKDAFDIAKDLNNDILIAHSLRYIDYDKQLSRDKKSVLLQEAANTFSKNNMEDHAIYCRNNALIQQFYTSRIDVSRFEDLARDAFYDVPELVGMSIVFNNAGVACLYTGDYKSAAEFFENGKQYGKHRKLQYFGLVCNELIARDLDLERIELDDLRRIITEIIKWPSCMSFAFLTANYTLNIIAIVLKQHPQYYKDITREYPALFQLINAALQPQLGQVSLLCQLITLSTKYAGFSLEKISINLNKSVLTSGLRESFILENGYNPTIFNAWL